MRKTGISTEEEEKILNILSGYSRERLNRAQVIRRIDTGELENDFKRLKSIFIDAKIKHHPNSQPPRFIQPIQTENLTLENIADSIPSQSRVLIKPNMVSKESYPETSDIDTIKTLIKSISKKTDHIYLGDGPSLFFDSNIAFERFKNIGPIYDFNKGPYRNVREEHWGSLLTIQIPEAVYSFDLIVNLCNLKAHDSFGYSGACKNMMGLISPSTRIRLHRMSSKDKMQAINELAQVFMPQIVVMDARKIMLTAQQKEYGGYETTGPGVFISTNPLKLDDMMKEKVILYE